MTKNKFFLLGLSAMMTLALGFTACSSDDNDGCTCTYTYNGQSETRTFTSEDLAEEDITSCAELTRLLEAELKSVYGEDYGSIKCK